jgi:hypothetical protein
MSREIAVSYGTNAVPAGSIGSVASSHYAPGSQAGARWVPGVSESPEISEPPASRDMFCSATTLGGTACKARPVRGSDLCQGHTRQKAAAE